MTSNRIPEPHPSSDSFRKASETSRNAKTPFGKIQASDSDEQAKKFQSYMGEEEKGQGKTAPNPFETLFHKETESDIVGKKTPLPTSDRASPPNVGKSTAESPLEGKDLPESEKFWTELDLSNEPVDRSPIQEKIRPGKAKEPTKKASEKKPQSTEPLTAQSTPFQEAPTERLGSSHMATPENQESISPNITTKHEKQHRASPEITAASLPALPADVQPMASAATSAAAPYLSDQTTALFHQMVGEIYMLEKSDGVSRTEIVLNSPAFASSKFYGAKIEIEKYETAPNSYNIRLTGSNEAVVSFRENIPSLMSAFNQQNISVTRIDAHYSPIEKPLVRRKEGTGSGTDQGGHR